jgi:UDPglucose 6-dehydrogenase
VAVYLGSNAGDDRWLMTRIAVTGIWHQGLVLSAALAELGHDVTGLVETEAIAPLQEGHLYLHEPGLAESLRAGNAAGKLRFTDDPREALAEAEFVYLSNDTLVDDADRSVLGDVVAVAHLVRENAQPQAILVVTAQVPVGMTERLAEISGLGAAYVPEFLQLGVALTSFREADRFVVGASDKIVGERVARLYADLGRPIVRTSIRTAEMAKHAANALLATEISFANELGDLCESVGADMRGVEAILRLDRRFGPYAYLSAGIGFSGGTLGRDLRALQSLGRLQRVKTLLVDAALTVNEARVPRVVARLERELGNLRGRKIALLGLTYTPGTSTLRRARSLEIATALQSRGVFVSGFDPLVQESELPEDTPLALFGSAYAAAKGADAIVYLTDWKGRDLLDLLQLRRVFSGDLFLDTRGDFVPDALIAAGFRYGRIPSDA